MLRKTRFSELISWLKKSNLLLFGCGRKLKDAVTVDVNSAKATSKKITGLKGGKKYYEQIRTYVVSNVEKVYSDWSIAKAVKTK